MKWSEYCVIGVAVLFLVLTALEITGYHMKCDMDTDHYTAEVCGLVAVQLSVNVLIVAATLCNCCHIVVTSFLGTLKFILALATVWIVWLYHWPPTASWTRTPVAVDAALTVLAIGVMLAATPPEPEPEPAYDEIQPVNVVV